MRAKAILIDPSVTDAAEKRSFRAWPTSASPRRGGSAAGRLSG